MTVTTFRIATRDGGVETRSGYVKGEWAVHKEPGPGVYFWTLTHLPTGMAVTVYPPPETKPQALAVLRDYDAHGARDKQWLIDRNPLLPAERPQ